MFRVGERVVCISVANSLTWAGTNRPTVGRVYTIRRVYPSPDEHAGGKLAVHLHEIANPIGPFGIECGFFAHHFRPVVERKTDISFAHEILRKASKKQEADA